MRYSLNTIAQTKISAGADLKPDSYSSRQSSEDTAVSQIACRLSTIAMLGALNKLASTIHYRHDISSITANSKNRHPPNAVKVRSDIRPQSQRPKFVAIAAQIACPNTAPDTTPTG